MEKYKIYDICGRRYQHVILMPGEMFLAGDLNMSPYRTPNDVILDIRSEKDFVKWELTEHEVDSDWNKGYAVLRRILEPEMNEFGEVSP